MIIVRCILDEDAEDTEDADGDCSRAIMFKGSSQPGWGSYVRPVGTTQGAGSVTAVPTYIMWLIAAIPMAEATANIKKHHRKLFFVTLREKSQVRYQLPSSENPGGP